MPLQAIQRVRRDISWLIAGVAVSAALSIGSNILLTSKVERLASQIEYLSPAVSRLDARLAEKTPKDVFRKLEELEPHIKSSASSRDGESAAQR